MVVSTSVVARRYEDVSAGAPISVDIPAYEVGDVYVYYGNASLVAVQGIDYTVALAGDFETFTVTPTASLLAKINALIAGDATEENYIVVRRTLDYLTDATPAGVRYTPYTSREFDRNAMRDLQLAERVGRALQLPPSVVPTDGVDTSLLNVSPGQYVKYKDDGTGFVGADAQLAVSQVDAWFQNRDVTSAAQAALLTNGSVVALNGLSYRVDSSATGTASATNDLGVNGLVPFGVVEPGHYGCAANGSTDDHDKLQRMHVHCEATGKLYRYPQADYLVSDTLVVKSSGDMSLATINADATVVSPAVQIGSATPSDEVQYITVNTPEIVNTTKTGTGWAGFDTSIGLLLANLYNCVVRVERVYGFGENLLCSGYDTGFVFNDIYLKRLDTGKKNLVLRAGDDTGWVNDNTFYNGRLYMNSAEGTNVAGTRNITLEESSPTQAYGRPNNNQFLKVGVEGSVCEYTVWNQGSYNTFIGCRWEGAIKVHHYARDANDAAENIYDGGYSPNSIVFSESGLGQQYTNVRGARTTRLSGSGQTIVLSNEASSGPTGRHIVGYGAGADYLGKSGSATDYEYLLYAQGFIGKRSADAEHRVKLDFQNGRLYLNAGASSGGGYFSSWGDTALTSSVDFWPGVDASGVDLGESTRRWDNGYIKSLRPGTGAPIWTSGTGTPEGAVTAPVGSMFTRTDGGAGTTLYIKESGAGNTGWAAK